MFKNKVKYTLISLIVVGTVGCTPPPRTMTIYTPPPSTQTAPRPTTTSVKRPPIKEEILLGGKGNAKNPNLGARVDVPVNNPTVAEVLTHEENLTLEVEEPTSPKGVIQRIPFPVDEYKYLKRRGRSTVTGKVFLENKFTSEKITKAKVKLWLNPVTSYSQQWYQDAYLGGYRLSKSDRRLFNYLKFTYSSADGGFSFFGVPKGEYYLTGTIVCSKECGFSKNKAVLVVRKVSVGAGTTTVNLTKRVP